MKEQPIKKAWACLLPEISWHDFQHSPEIIYAKTRSKAKYALSLKWDWHEDSGWIHIKVRRSAENDLYKPNPDEILLKITEEQKQIIAHANGNGGDNPGYRDYYHCSARDRDLLKLVDIGLMVGPQHVDSKMIRRGNGYFYLTEKGKDAAFSMLPRKKYKNH